MAGFELVRARGIAAAAREWRPGRFLPLYLAGIAFGAAVGIGLSFADGGTETVSRATLGQSSAETLVFEAPAEFPTPGAPPAASDWNAAMDATVGLLEPQPAPVVPEVAPVAPVVAQPVATVPKPSAPAAPQQAAQAPAAPAEKPNFYLPTPASGGATSLESHLLASINAERAKAGMAPYSYDAGLTRIARIRSQQLVDQGYFGHVDPFGYSMYTELLAYYGYGYAWAGENLAMNNYSLDTSASRAVTSLMNSPSHRANILAGDFFRIGIGEVTSADGRHFYTMIFLG